MLISVNNGPLPNLRRYDARGSMLFASIAASDQLGQSTDLQTLLRHTQ